MLDLIKKGIPGFWDKYRHFFKEKIVQENTILLREGEISESMYFVQKGCLRLWFNKDGKDITFQFFFENQGVSSIESFMNRVPSLFALETIEPCILFSLSKSDFDILLNEEPLAKDGFLRLIVMRMQNYSRLFLSRIKDSPRERYLEIVKDNPQILERVPQHYIASYLGITPVSLSRIKNKK